jgi:hypothetical protein
VKNTFLSLFLFFSLLSAGWSQDILLDEIVLDPVPIHPSQTRVPASTGSRPGVRGSRGLNFQTVGPGFVGNRDGKHYRIRILEVRPLSGNNPLDPVEPLLNYDGQRVQTIDDLVQVISSGRSGGGSSFEGCIGSAPMHVVAGPGGANPPRSTLIYGANFNIDAQTLACTDPPPGTPGQGNFSITWRTVGVAPLIEYFSGSPPPGNPQDWQWDDAGILKNFGISGPANQVRTLIAVSISGARLEMVLRVDDAGIGAPVLNVVSLRKLN